jgi:hypothetical protein
MSIKTPGVYVAHFIVGAAIVTAVGTQIKSTANASVFYMELSDVLSFLGTLKMWHLFFIALGVILMGYGLKQHWDAFDEEANR